MITINDNLVREITSRLVREFTPEKIILFGSHAWGTPGQDSDLDLLVIVPESGLSPARRAARGHRSLRGLGVSTDILVRTRIEFDRYCNVPASLEHRILQQGKILYG